MLYRLSYVGGASVRFYLLNTQAQFMATIDDDLATTMRGACLSTS